MYYTQEDVSSLSRVGITLQDALQMGLSIRDADDIKREVLENRAFTGFPALTLKEEHQLEELRLEKQTGERFTGVDLAKDERTHLSNDYPGNDETVTTPEFLRVGDSVKFLGPAEVRRSRDGKKLMLVTVSSVLIIGIGATGKIYQMIVPNKF